MLSDSPPAARLRAQRQRAQEESWNLWLEDYPLCAHLDRLLDEVEEPSHVDVAPGRITAQRSGPPDADSATGKRPDAVDANRVERVLLAFGNRGYRRQRTPHNLVGGSLVNAALVVVAGVDASHMAGRWHCHWATIRPTNGDPRVIQRGV